MAPSNFNFKQKIGNKNWKKLKIIHYKMFYNKKNIFCIFFQV